jgi:hypothetical protein
MQICCATVLLLLIPEFALVGQHVRASSSGGQSKSMSNESKDASAQAKKCDDLVARKTIWSTAWLRLVGAVIRLTLHVGMTEAEVERATRVMGGIRVDQLEGYSFSGLVPSYFTITDKTHGLRLLYRADRSGVFRLDDVCFLPIFTK